MFKKLILIIICALSLNENTLAYADQEFYARSADEYMVSFRAVIKTEFKSLAQIAAFSNLQKQDFNEYVLKPTTKYLFGPLTHRSLGGEQKGFSVVVHWDQAYEENGSVILPFTYSGQWLINNQVGSPHNLQIPLPLHFRLLRTPNWKNCTDSEHGDLESYWYYWDPARNACDQILGEHYQMIKPELSKKTQKTSRSYPEYKKMLRNNTLRMSFAFGYVEDNDDPQPFSDSDYGMQQFRSFVQMLRNEVRSYAFRESDIFETEFLGGKNQKRRIGSRFVFEKNGTNFEVKVLASGSIDQMELFTKSFAHDHDAFFGWFGHSRVGNGFDAFQFSRLLRQNPNFYELTSDYQMIYWAGCNSYSYYTKPFFDFKSDLLKNDSTGTKSLDIISNGLPSYFSLNAANALVLLRAIVNFDKPASYQDIVNRIEMQSNSMGIYVLANVLGDEDNDQ